MRSMRFTSIALAATTVVAGSFAVAPATASASVSTRSTVAVERQQDASWVVTVTPSPYPTFQSEHDRVMRKTIRAGFEATRLGNDAFVVRGGATLAALQTVLAGDDAVASIVAEPAPAVTPVDVDQQAVADWMVTVTPSPYPTPQSERDRVLRKAVRAGYQVQRVGKDQFVMFGVAGLTAAQAVFAGDDAVVSIVVVPGA